MGQIFISNHSVPGTILDPWDVTKDKQAKMAACMVFTLSCDLLNLIQFTQ